MIYLPEWWFPQIDVTDYRQKCQIIKRLSILGQYENFLFVSLFFFLLRKKLKAREKAGNSGSSVRVGVRSAGPITCSASPLSFRLQQVREPTISKQGCASKCSLRPFHCKHSEILIFARWCVGWSKMQVKWKSSVTLDFPRIYIFCITDLKLRFKRQKMKT